MKKKEYFPPHCLPCCNDATLRQLCDDGKITPGEELSAKWRRQATWAQDPVSKNFRALRDFITEKQKQERAQS